jgi:hypothetical protein
MNSSIKTKIRKKNKRVHDLRGTSVDTIIVDRKCDRFKWCSADSGMDYEIQRGQGWRMAKHPKK